MPTVILWHPPRILNEYDVGRVVWMTQGGQLWLREPNLEPRVVIGAVTPDYTLLFRANVLEGDQLNSVLK
jgi:hypothetical protein